MRTRRTQQRKPSQQKPVSLDSPITAVKGVNSKLAPKLRSLGLATARDLLYFFPRRHIDYSSSVSISELAPETEQTVLAQVWGASSKKSSCGMWVTEALVGDDTGMMQVIWFNQPYLERKLVPNSRIAMIGRTKIWKGNKVFQPTSFEVLDQGNSLEGALIPVYPLTEGVYPRQLRGVVRQALDSGLPYLQDFLPEGVRNRVGLRGLAEAIWQAHYPDNGIAKDAARHRLAFDELLLMQVGLLMRKHQRQEANVGVKLDSDPGYVEGFLVSLSFELTQAQRRTLEEIQKDLARERPMSRLLQGDVGSGKTIEGELIRSCSSALPRPIRVGLLVGSSAEKDKKEIYSRAAAGDVDILIGTHALIQKKLHFHELGLAVVDEQHRFGVMQRLELRQRVWRSSYQSYCILLSDQPSDAARERLSIMESTHNGFRLAEEDLKIRGPGEFFGTRQSGLPELKMAQLTDMELLALTQKEAGSIVESDPRLEELEHQALADEVVRLWQRADG